MCCVQVFSPTAGTNLILIYGLFLKVHATSAETHPLAFKEELDIRQEKNRLIKNPQLPAPPEAALPWLHPPSHIKTSWRTGWLAWLKGPREGAEPLSPNHQSDFTASGGLHRHQCRVRQESVDKSNTSSHRNTVRTPAPEVHLP